MRKPRNVLITCVGSGIGQSVVDSLKHRKDEYRLVGSDRNIHSYGVPDCDDFAALPPIDNAEYIDALLQTCVEREIDAAIPGHDLELTLWARHRRRFEKSGTQPIVASERLVALLRDKRAWSAEFGTRTTHVVPACTVEEFRRAGQDDRFPFPAIAKPAGGSASAGLRILRSLEDADGLGDEYIVQPFLFPARDDPDGPSVRAAVAAGRVVQVSEISVQLVYSRDGVLLGRFASRNRLKAGVPVEFLPVDSGLVWSAVDEICSVLADFAPRGPINLQGRITDDGVVFFEMNPRFTGITGNRSLFGFNEVALLVDNFTTGARRPLRIGRSKVGVRQVACRTWPRERFTFGGIAAQSRGTLSIVVLGGTSWLARSLVAERARRGDFVTAICRNASIEAAKSMYRDLANVEILDSGSGELADCVAASDVVVNCASARPPHGPQGIVDAHLHQMRLLDIAENCEVPFIVNVSSQSVYPQGAADKAETAPLDGSSPYAFSKISIEESIRGISRRKPSTAAVSLRMARLFGPSAGFREDEFPHRLVCDAVRGRQTQIRHAATVLDLLDVRDAVGAIGFFVDTLERRFRGDVFNVGSGRPVTVADFVALADRICGERFARGLRTSVTDDGADEHCGLDCGKIAGLGWTSVVTLERSLNDLFDVVDHAA